MPVKRAGLAIALLTASLFLNACTSDFVTGKEIEDDYLVGFFRPQMEHRHVRVIETEAGKKFVVISFGRKLGQEEVRQYQVDLAKKGLSEYSSGRHVPFRLFDFFGKREVHYEAYEMFILRPTSEEGVIEVSRNEINQPHTEKRSATRVIGRYLTEIAIEVSQDFGHRWDRLKFTPEKDISGDDPAIGRYPGSIRVEATRGEQDNIFKYYVQDPVPEIIDVYRSRYEELARLRPGIKMMEDSFDFSTEAMYGLNIRPAKSRSLFIKGENIAIVIAVSQSHLTEKLKILRIEERVPVEEDRGLIEQAVRRANEG